MKQSSPVRTVPAKFKIKLVTYSSIHALPFYCTLMLPLRRPKEEFIQHYRILPTTTASVLHCASNAQHHFHRSPSVFRQILASSHSPLTTVGDFLRDRRTRDTNALPVGIEIISFAVSNIDIIGHSWTTGEMATNGSLSRDTPPPPLPPYPSSATTPQRLMLTCTCQVQRVFAPAPTPSMFSLSPAGRKIAGGEAHPWR